jgi:hypothetical protein
MINSWNSEWNDSGVTNVPPEPKQDEFHIPLEVRAYLSQNNYSQDRDGLLMLWQKAKDDIEKAKNFEMEIRKLAVKATFEKPKEGTEYCRAWQRL